MDKTMITQEDRDLNTFGGDNFDNEPNHINILEGGEGTYLVENHTGVQSKRHFLDGGVYPGRNILNIKTSGDLTVDADKIILIF